MKVIKFAALIACALTLSLVTGCQKRPTTLTNLPGAHTSGPGQGDLSTDPKGSTGLGNENGLSGRDINDKGGLSQVNPGAFDNYTPNSEIFSGYTVYFDFDSHVVKEGEKSKVAHVADYLKSNPSNALRVEGHCDERGTEEYNRALGDRRANALREELARLGADPGHVVTISYGEDKPADPGHDNAAYAKNRRGVFVLLTPPK